MGSGEQHRSESCEQKKDFNERKHNHGGERKVPRPNSNQITKGASGEREPRTLHSRAGANGKEKRAETEKHPSLTHRPLRRRHVAQRTSVSLQHSPPKNGCTSPPLFTHPSTQTDTPTQSGIYLVGLCFQGQHSPERRSQSTLLLFLQNEERLGGNEKSFSFQTSSSFQVHQHDSDLTFQNLHNTAEYMVIVPQRGNCRVPAVYIKNKYYKKTE